MFEIIKVKAILLSEVVLDNVIIDLGTEIVVDPERNIGLYNSQHFDLRKDEYKILFLN